MRDVAIIAAREEWQQARSADEIRPFLRLIIDNRSRWPKDKRARRFAEQAQRYIEACRWSDALAACERAIAIEPNYPWGNLIRAATLLWAGRHAEAVDAASRAIELAPKLSWPHCIRGESLVKLRRFGEALVSADHALQISADHALQIPQNVLHEADAHVIRSGALLGLGKVDDALAAAERAIALVNSHSEPIVTLNSPRAHGLRASALTELGRWDEALQAIELTCEISPRWSRAHAVRAGVLIECDRIDEAITAIQLACDLEPEFTGSNEFRELLFRIGESKTAGYTGDTPPSEAAVTPPLRMRDDFNKEEGVGARLLRDLSSSQLAAVLEDTTLGRLLARYEKGLAELELRPEGFTSKEQADAASNVAVTLRRLQELQTRLALPVTATREQVLEGEAMAAKFRRTHDETGAPIPLRPRGRPRRDARQGNATRLA